MKTFSRDIQTSKPPDTVRTEALTSLTEPLARYDYVLMTQSESGLTLLVSTGHGGSGYSRS